jgi:predicted glycoside hydrolase/deacetylase ChbG (UPF0249 family)
LELIFHADDLGATPGVSRKILDAWQAGLIDSFSIIANGTGLDLVLEQLKRYPEREARISVHLNLSDGKSVLPPEDVSMLVDRDGYFRYGFSAIFLKLCLCSPRARRRLLSEIEREWREQIRRIREICRGRRIQAVDGHIHVHVLPFLFPVAAKLALEEEIPEIRIPGELWSRPGDLGRMLSPRFYVNQLKWAVLRILAGWTSRRKRRYGLDGPESFVGVLNAGRMTGRDVRSALGKARKSGVDSCEILFHVGSASAEELSRWKPLLPTFRFLISEGREKEYEELVRLRSSLDGEEPTVSQNREGAGG